MVRTITSDIAIIGGGIVGLATGLIGGGMLIPLGTEFADVVLGGGRDAAAVYGLLQFMLGIGMAVAVVSLPFLQGRLPKEMTFVAAVFVAEMAAKTQLVTMLFATDKEVSKWLVFVGASLALIATSAIGVLGGGLISQYVSERALRAVDGICFIAIGIWTLWR